MPSRVEADLTALIESTEDLIWSVDLDYRLVTFNRALARAFSEGYGVQVAAGMALSDLLPPARAALFPSLYERALREGPFRTEYILRDSRTLELALNPILDGDKATGVAVFGKDITERKTAEKTLLEAKEKLQDIFDGALEGIYQTSEDGRVLTVNRALARMGGYDSPEELIREVQNTALEVWTNPEERAKVLKLMEETNQLRGYESQFKRKDGSLIWVSLNIRRVPGKDGQASYLEGFVEDITQRKLAEAQIQAAEKKFHGIFNDALEGIFQTSMTGRPLNANPAVARMLGYDSTEDFLATVTDSARDVWLNPGERERYVKLLEEKGAMRGFECQFKRKDGTPIWVSLNTRKTEAADGTSVNEGFVEDITERKQAEAALQATLQRFYSILSSMYSAVLLVADGGQVEFANQAFCNLFCPEDSPESLVGMSPSSVIDRIVALFPQPEKTIARIQEVVQADELVLGEEISLQSGRVFLRDFVPLRIGGNSFGRLWVHTDITERKLAEEELREREARLREAEQVAQLGSVTWDLDTDTVVWSEGMYSLTGLDPKTPAPRRAEWAKLFTPESWEFLDAALNLALATGESADAQLQLVRADGALRWLRLCGKSGRDPSGRVNRLVGTLQDITEQKLAEEELHEREARLREAEQIAHLGNVTWDVDTDTVAWSEGIYSITGLDPKAPAPRRAEWAKLLTPESWDLLCTAVQRALATGEPYNLQLQVVRVDGALRWARARGKAGRSESGRVNRLFGTLQDITEQKLDQIKLRDSEENFRATFEQAAVGMVHASLEGRILRCNARFAEILGYSQEEIPGTTFQQITAPGDLTPSIDELEHIFGGDTSPAQWEKRYVRKDGSLTWVKVTLSVQRDAEGRMLHRISVVEDINDRKRAEMQLRDSEERYRTVFDTGPDAALVSRLSDGAIIDANRKFLDSSGFERAEVIGRTTLELGIWPNPDDRRILIERLLKHTTVQGLEVQSRRKDGEIFWMRLSARLIEIGGDRCLLAFAQDITQAKASEERLAAAAKEMKASETRYRTVFQTSLDGVLITHFSDGMIVDFNQAFLSIMGYEREEVIGRTTTEIDMWTDFRTRQDLMDAISRESVLRDVTIPFKRKNKEVFWVQLSTSVIELDGVQCILSVLRDTSEMRAAEERIKDLAFYDPLTHLPNRRLLSDSIHEALAASSHGEGQCALLFVDLDNFKTLNDALGHQAGDLLLQEVSLRLSGCVRQTDTVARLGGDEFAVLLEHLSQSTDEAALEAGQVGEKILVAVGLPYVVEGHGCHCASSIGIAIFGDELESANDVLNRAEIAMFDAKDAGRNTLRFFAPARQAAVTARATREEDLRQAVKGNQFVLYYQPQVDRGKMEGVEALIRWNHPKHGILLPEEFIHLAEETRLILPIGLWVLETACKQVVAWAARKETRHMTIAVNISALQLHQPDFVDQVMGTLAGTGANPNNLRLELTESMFLDRTEETIAKMTALRSHGLRFSLDDFGTGYSSLSYLKRLPLDRMKIDRAFVRDILEDATSGAIAQTVIALSRAMGLSVIAEGVETEEQRDYLIALGCHAFQGFLFSQPLPLEELEQMLPQFAGLDGVAAG
jgi:diguanylate cyclase (GGDEF)-like protein/PAS domain S-box-containing protein